MVSGKREVVEDPVGWPQRRGDQKTPKRKGIFQSSFFQGICETFGVYEVICFFEREGC